MGFSPGAGCHPEGICSAWKGQGLWGRQPAGTAVPGSRRACGTGRAPRQHPQHPRQLRSPGRLCLPSRHSTANTSPGSSSPPSPAALRIPLPAAPRNSSPAVIFSAGVVFTQPGQHGAGRNEEKTRREASLPGTAPLRLNIGHLLSMRGAQGSRGMHPFAGTGQRDAGLQGPPHLPVGWARSAVSLDSVPRALSTPGAVLKPEVTWPLACSRWEDAAAPRILQDMGDGIPCFGTLRGEMLGPLRGDNPPFS